MTTPKPGTGEISPEDYEAFWSGKADAETHARLAREIQEVLESDVSRMSGASRGFLTSLLDGALEHARKKQKRSDRQ